MLKANGGPRLTSALAEALTAFLRVLDGYSLADLMQKRQAFAGLFGLESRPADN